MLNTGKKSWLGRSLLALVLAVALVLPMVPVSFAETTELDVSVYKPSEDSTTWTYPTEEGKVFAGWYTDATYATPYADITGTAYPKFVDAELISVKRQFNVAATKNSDTVDLRFITGLDSLNYHNVIFNVEIPSQEKSWTWTEKTAYSSLLADGETKEAAEVFTSASYLVVHSLNNIPNAVFAESFEVTVSWTTLDGTVVIGETVTFTPNSLLKEPVQISLQNFDALTAGDAVGTMQGTTAKNYGPASAAVSAANGISNSQSMAYTIESADYNQNQNVQLDDELAAHTVQDGTDILWFWVDSDLTNERLLHVQINGTLLKQQSIYTIVSDNGTPKMVSVEYVNDRAAVETMAPVNSNWTLDGTYARIKLPIGWNGWIGIPMANVDITSGTIEKIQLRVYGDRNLAPVAVGEVVYMDQFWLTSANTMPDLTDAELLYNGDPTVTPDPDPDPDPDPEPTTHQTQLWDLNDSSNGTVIGTVGGNTKRDVVEVTAKSGAGMIDASSNITNALAYTVTTYVSGTQTQANNVTISADQLSAAGYATAAKIVAIDDVFWFWLESDLTTSQRLEVRLNDRCFYKADANGTAAYIYTIANSNGTPTPTKVELSATVNGISLQGHSDWTRIQVASGWSGWIGMPVNFFALTDTADADGDSNKNEANYEDIYQVSDSIDKIAIVMGWTKNDPAYTNRSTGAVYFDEFWLTSNGKMPNLTNAQLLYTPAKTASAQSATLLFNTNNLTSSKENDLLLKEKEYYLETASNSQPTQYFTFEVVEGNGYKNGNTIQLGVAGDNPGNYTNWGILDFTYESAITDLNVSGNTSVNSNAMLWIWIDATDLSKNGRLNVKISNGTTYNIQNKLGGYYYLIEEVSGGYTVSDPIPLITNSNNSTATVTAGTEGLIPLTSGFKGWVGIPVYNYVASGTVNISRVAFNLKRWGVSTQTLVAGEDIYIGDFYIGEKIGGSWEIPPQ